MTFADRLQASLAQLWDFVPGLLGAAVVLIAGYLLAKAVQKGALRVLRRVHLNDVLRKGGVMQAVDRAGTHLNPTRVVAGLLFWLVMFTVMLVAANALGPRFAGAGVLGARELHPERRSPRSSS